MIVFVYFTLFIYLCSIYLSIHPILSYPSILSILSIYLSICLSIYLSTYLSILSIYLSIYLSILSIYLSIYLSTGDGGYDAQVRGGRPREDGRGRSTSRLLGDAARVAGRTLLQATREPTLIINTYT